MAWTTEDLWARWRTEAAASCGWLSEAKLASASFKTLLSAARKAGLPVFQKSQTALASALLQYRQDLETKTKGGQDWSEVARLPPLLRKKRDRILRLEALDRITRLSSVVCWGSHGSEGPDDSEEAGEPKMKKSRKERGVEEKIAGKMAGPEAAPVEEEGSVTARGDHSRWVFQHAVPVTGADQAGMRPGATVTDGQDTELATVVMLVGEYLEVLKGTARHSSKRVRCPRHLVGWVEGGRTCDAPGDCMEEGREVCGGLGKLVGCSINTRQTDWAGRTTVTTSSIVKFRALRPGRGSVRIVRPVDFDCWTGTRGPQYTSETVFAVHVVEKDLGCGMSDSVATRGVGSHLLCELTLDLTSSHAHDVAPIHGC